MKRILAMVLSVAIIASLAIGGTVAYLTDSDAATNVFAVGNVEIELMEEQRKVTATGTGTETKSTELEDFEPNKNLMPIVTPLGEDGNPKTGYDSLGMNTAQNYQDKIVRVKNTGSSDAWVRIFVAVPAALENTDPSKTVLHWDVGDRFDTTLGGQYNSSNTGNPFTEEFDKAEFKGKMDIDGIDGLEYNVYCFTRQTPLEPEHITAAAFVGFYLDENVDNNSGDGYYYIGSKKDENNRITVKCVGEKDGDDKYYDAYDFSNGVVIPVYAEAVQTSGFATAEEAFSRAIEAGSTKPYNPWAEGGNATVELPDEVKTVDELVTALNELNNASGKQTITLSHNKKYDFSGKSAQFYFAKADAEITIEGNGAIITGLTKPLINSVQSKSITIKDLTISGLNLTDTEKLGGTYIGAFIQTTYTSTENITFSNCHLVNSTIEAKKTNDHVGGLIGCACLKSASSSTVTIENCSVINCNLSGNQNVGGLIGWLYNGKTTAVSDSEVKNCNLTSKNTGSMWRIGAILGTQDYSNTTVTSFMRSGNTLTQANESNRPDLTKDNRDLYGYRAYGSTFNVN